MAVIPVDDFSYFKAFFSEFKGLYHGHFRNRTRERSIRSLMSQMKAAMRFAATDPRDKVYSLLATTARSEVQSIRPDYTADCADVFAKATLAMRSSSGELDIEDRLTFLIYVTCHGHRMANLPSWAIDFTFQRSGGVEMDNLIDPIDWTLALSGRGVHTRPWLQIRPSVKAISQLHSDGRTLTLTGLVFDRIKSEISIISTPHAYNGRDLLSQDSRLAIQNLLQQLPERNPYRAVARGDWNCTIHESCTCEEAVMDWLRLQQSGITRPNEIEGYLDALFLDWKHSFKAGEDLHADMEPDQVYSTGKKATSVTAWLHYNAFATGNSAFFTTTFGFVGIANSSIEAGDTIALLYGCETPVILRPEGDRYRFRGLACVNGIMENELLQAIPDAMLEEVQFELI
jgi:hypothetical protein